MFSFMYVDMPPKRPKRVLQDFDDEFAALTLASKKQRRDKRRAKYNGSVLTYASK